MHPSPTYWANKYDCYVPMGLAAAMTVHLACSEVTMPALEMEMLCCSMASWILVLSASFIWEDTKSGIWTFFIFIFKRRRGCPPIWIPGFSSPYQTHRSDRLHGRPAPALPPQASTHGSLGVSEHKRSNQRRRPPDLWWTPHGSRPSLRTCRWKHVSASSETILLFPPTDFFINIWPLLDSCGQERRNTALHM